MKDQFSENEGKETFFAPPERADAAALQKEIAAASKNPVIDTLLVSVGGLIAILNEQRQIIAVNDAFLHTLGVDDPGEVLGLRPGEAMGCVHAYDEPAGCGTTEFCSTCGAAVAMVAALGYKTPVERMCALAVDDGTGRGMRDVALRVRAHSFTAGEQTLLLLFLQDITREQHRAALERTFYHDVSNLIEGLLGASEVLVSRETKSKLITLIRTASFRLKREVELQKYLSDTQNGTYQLILQDIAVAQVWTDLKNFFDYQPEAEHKTLRFPDTYPDISFKTDVVLLMRILCNMIINAFEATPAGREVRVWAERDAGMLSFFVWNEQAIPADVARRVFQRNFSTKEGDGRGLGTYAMKRFGETLCGGKVSFLTSPGEGTIFCFAHPLDEVKSKK